MKFTDINPPTVELPTNQTFFRVQLAKPRSTSVRMNGVVLPPAGLLTQRFDLPNESVAYLADSPDTALFEALMRREVLSLSLPQIKSRCLTMFKTLDKLRLADLRNLGETYPLFQSLRFGQTQRFAQDCRAMELDGIWYTSGQHPNHSCVALFPPGIPKLKRGKVTPLVQPGSDQLLIEVSRAIWRAGIPLLG